MTQEDEQQIRYAEYIMKHSDRTICNGDMLIGAMESGYLWDEFLESEDECQTH